MNVAEGVSATGVSAPLHDNVVVTAVARAEALPTTKGPPAGGSATFAAEAAKRLQKNGVRVNAGEEDGCGALSQPEAQRPIVRLAKTAGTVSWSFSKSTAQDNESEVVGSGPSLVVNSEPAATPGDVQRPDGNGGTTGDIAQSCLSSINLHREGKDNEDRSLTVTLELYDSLAVRGRDEMLRASCDCSMEAKEEFAMFEVKNQCIPDDLDTSGGVPPIDDVAAVSNIMSDEEHGPKDAHKAECYFEMNHDEIPGNDPGSRETEQSHRNFCMDDIEIENRHTGTEQPMSSGVSDEDDKTINLDLHGSPERNESGVKLTVNSPSTIASDDEVFHDSWDKLNHDTPGTEENFSLAIFEVSHDTPARHSTSKVLSLAELSSTLADYSQSESDRFHDVGEVSFDDSSVAIMADKMHRRHEASQFTDSWMHGDTIQNLMGWADQAIRASDTDSVKNFEMSFDLNGLNDFDDESTIATMQDDMSVMSAPTSNISSTHPFPTSGNYGGIDQPFEEWENSHDPTVNSSMVAASILFNGDAASLVPTRDLNLLNMGLSFPTNVSDVDTGLPFGTGDAGFDDGLGFGGNGFGYGNGENMKDFGMGAVDVENKAEERKKSPEHKGWFRGWIG